METKHSKGKWKVAPQPFSLLVTHEVNGKEESICQISQRYKSESQQQANANLIAAAPELLEALELATKRILQLALAADLSEDLLDIVTDEVGIFKNAIKKAKGE